VSVCIWYCVLFSMIVSRVILTRLYAPARRAFGTHNGHNLVFLGAPGVGKGTFASRIAKKLNIPAISTGDIIRAEIKRGEKFGKELKRYTDAGRLVPDELVTAMVKSRLQDADARKGYILVRGCVMKRMLGTRVTLVYDRTDIPGPFNRQEIWIRSRSVHVASRSNGSAHSIAERAFVSDVSESRSGVEYYASGTCPDDETTGPSRVRGLWTGVQCSQYPGRRFGYAAAAAETLGLRAVSRKAAVDHAG
jgi:adenylate kinase family enzyme